MLYPLKFAPLLVSRVWGGNSLNRFGKSIPPGQRIGESWEITDRDDAQSVVLNGVHKGKTLHQLIDLLGPQLIGRAAIQASTPAVPDVMPGQTASAPATPRFPLLVKLIDARERLSLQVHPPVALAAKLKGEPKTEMWYVLDADPHAHLIAGLRRGVSGADFIRALENPSPAASLEGYVHRFRVSRGDVFFVPSGRLHAIDAGLVLVEIQQNSDTTYRVNDWGRQGQDGKPRELHVQKAVPCIDFEDIEPKKTQPRFENRHGNGLARLVECDYFHVHRIDLHTGWSDRCDDSSFHIIGCLEGTVGILAGNSEEYLAAGEFALLPAALGQYSLMPQAEITRALKVFLPA